MKGVTRNSLYGGERFLAKSAGGIGISPRTITDWLQTSIGSHRAAQYGVFGNSALLKKQDITGAGDTFSSTDFFTNTFGAKVWDALNSQTRTFNLIRKVGWGPTTGWRIRSGRNRSTRGVAETGALPEIDSPDIQNVHIQPSFIVSSMGVSALAQFLSTLEGGIGDALAVEQESGEVDHLYKVNRMILAPSEIRVATGGASGTAALVSGGADMVGIGDTFYRSGQPGAANYITIDDVNYDTDVINYTTTGNTNNLAADEVLYVRTRLGLTSLSDVVNHHGRQVGGATLTGAGAGYGSLAYGDRAAGRWNASYVNGNNGTVRHLTTGHLDRAIREVRINGFQPDLIITGVEQEERLGVLLQANQHFVGNGTFQVKEGGEATLPGYETGFQVSTYKNIPVFQDAFTTQVWQLPGAGDAVRGSDAYVLDTRFLEVPVLFTTQYVESRDYIHNNMLGIKAIFLTAANLRCMNFRAQARVTDLSDGSAL